MRGADRTLFWGPYNEDPTIWGARNESPIFGNSQITVTFSVRAGIVQSPHGVLDVRTGLHQGPAWAAIVVKLWHGFSPC